MQVIHTNKSFFKVALTIFPSLLFLLSVNGVTSALTYQNSTDVEFTINPSINITLSDPNLIIDDLTPGSSSDSNIITATVSTNAGYGYYMSATAGTSSTDTNLTSSTGSIFTNLSSNAATLSSFPDNYWGYSYSTDNGTTWISGSQGNTNTGYNGLPLDNDDSGATGVILNSTDSFTNSGSVKFKIGAKASPSQASGTYTNTVNFYAVANPEPQLGPESCNPRKICYHANALTTVEGTMGEQSKDVGGDNIVDGATVTLLASNYSRQGYGFAGWSDTYDYTGNLYGPQETITTPTGTSTNGLSLYAIWIKSAGSMQSDATSICSSLTTASSATKTLSSVSALTDQRDGDTYAIAKLADGNCWMIENLRLESTNSDNSTGTLAQGYGTSSTYGNFSGLATAEISDFSDSTIANSLYYSGTQEDTASVDIGTSDYPGYRMPRYNNWNHQASSTDRPQNPTRNSTTNSTTNASMYSYGNYYTWAAAIADTTYRSTNNQSVTDTSLCPSGWRLPKSGDKTRITSNNDNEFWNLTVTALNNGSLPANYNSSNIPAYHNAEAGPVDDRLRAYPNNFLYSGNFYTSSTQNRGGIGIYWSSTARSYGTSYSLYLTDNSVYPGTNTLTKSNGYSVRCIVSAGT